MDGEIAELELNYGPLSAFMVDATVEEIWINSPSRIFVARNGVSELKIGRAHV